MTPKPFSVRIFLQDGHVDGVKMIARSKWSGRAMVIPRAALADEITRPELMMPAVYVLVGPAPGNGMQPISLGSADPVCRALEEEDSQTSSWTSVVVFASKDDSLSLSQVQYLHSRLVQLALMGGRNSLESRNGPGAPVLSKAGLVEAEAFLEHILSLCPLLGLTGFDNTTTVRRNESSQGSRETS